MFPELPFSVSSVELDVIHTVVPPLTVPPVAGVLRFTVKVALYSGAEAPLVTSTR